MPVSRRRLLAGTAGVAMLARAGRPTRARAAYPDKPVRLQVGFTPGGATDFVARVLAEGLASRLGQSVVVENRPGAGQLIAMEYVARAAPDGSILMFASAGATTLLPALKRSMPYRMPDAFSYIARVTSSAYVLVVNPALPFRTMQEVTAYARANPGKLRFATPGVGTDGDMESLLLEQSGGFTLTRVPYRGGAPALTDVMSGVVDIGMQSLEVVADLAAAGKIRLIAYTGGHRDVNAPDVPTLTEAGLAGATMTNWLGVLGPAGLPEAIQARLRDAAVDCVRDPATRDRLVKLDFDPTPVTGADFRKQVVRELAQWRDVARKANLVVD